MARITVQPAPMATANKKCGEAATALGTRPLPENACTSPAARNTEAMQPAKVAPVASVIACL